MKIFVIAFMASMMLLAQAAPQWWPYAQNDAAKTTENAAMEKALIQAVLAMAHADATNQHKSRLANQNQFWSNRQGTEKDQIFAQERLPPYNPTFIQAASPRPPYAKLQGNELEAVQQAFNDPRGIEIQNCGVAGNIIQSALQFGLSFIPGASNAYGVFIACSIPSGVNDCTIVQVAVPSGGNNMKADIDVCRRPSK